MGKQWEIWQVPWEHEDGTRKNRPALILSTNADIAASGRMICVKISSKPHPIGFRIDIPEDDSSFSATGLTKKSYVYPAATQWFNKDELLWRRGLADNKLALKVDNVIKICNLPNPEK